MVSSQVSGLTLALNSRTGIKNIILPMGPPDVVSASENEEFDFSDVFGTTPVQASTGVSSFLPSITSPVQASNGEESEQVYSDPVVIQRRSHSLVGPTSRVMSPKVNMSVLTLHERKSSLDLLDTVSEESSKEQETISENDEKVENKYNINENKDDYNNNEGVGLEDFEVLKLVGQGAFGKVYQVKKKGTTDIYAMKVLRKDKILEKNHVEYTKAERDILTKIDHPFIIQLRYSFQTKYRLYLVLDFVNGGHLFFQLYHHGLFREDLARIYAAEIVSAVSHLHANGIMHRDLKPENILLDSEGHAMLTDFGLAKEFNENTRSNSMCGTVEYMAPEIIQGRGHDKAADWWSVGILLFEMLTGKPPFAGNNRDKVQQKIVKEKIKLPGFLTSEAHSLLKGLLNKEVNKRLGSGTAGSNEIKNHKWFKSINWRKLEGREIQPSFIPNVAGQSCVKNFDEKWTSMPLLDSPVASPVAAGNNFLGFSYVHPAAEFLRENKPSPLG